MGKLIGGSIMGVILWVAMLVAWVTHVVTCIKAAAWFLLLIGAIVAPVGVIHGVMIWFGAPFV